MNLMTFSHALLPLSGLILLIIGLYGQYSKCVLGALWFSLISVLLQYQTAGGEILGSYFDFSHGLLYSFTLFILLISAVYLIWKFAKDHSSKKVHLFASLFVALAITGFVALLANLAINARFLKNKLPGSPVLQVATFTKPDYCHYQYVFYAVNKEGELTYMCPCYYGLVPSVGKLADMPDFLARQLPGQLQERLKHKKD